jgi:hypothetical protein
MLRLAALVAAGSFAVHQLRYLLASHGAAEIEAPAHAYLARLTPVLAALLLIAVGEAIRRVARGAASPSPRLAPLWLAATSALLVVYSAQELAEGSSVTADGGWLALPLAALMALAIAVALRGTDAAAELARRRRPWRTPVALGPAQILRPASARAPRVAVPLARTARAPPAVLV